MIILIFVLISCLNKNKVDIDREDIKEIDF